MGSAWVNDSHLLITYDANDFMIEVLMQDWVNNAWVNEDKSALTNNTNGYVTQILDYTWLNNTWKLEYRSTYSYTAQWWLTQEKSEFWNGTEWINETLYSYSYDAQGRILEELEQSWIAKGWVNYYISIYTYGLPLGITLEDNISVNSQIFPNPANEFVSVDISALNGTEATIKLLDATGRPVEDYHLMMSAGQHSLIIPTQHLPSGHYFLIVSGSKNSVQKHKLIVQH